MKEIISVVVPVYQGEPFIAELVHRTRTTIIALQVDYEIILINDSSPDNSWQIIENECKKDCKVIGINLSRNFGQHYAMAAGLEHATGSWIVVMDCDLQDVPEEISKLYNKAKDGFELVLAQRVDRKDSFFKRYTSKVFYGALSWLAGTEYDHQVANFGIYHRKVIDAILTMGDSIRFFPSMVKWVGFHATFLEVRHAQRIEGKSSYNFKRLMYLALDIILSFSEKPIRLAIKAGLFISFLSFLATVYAVIAKLLGVIEVAGYASVIISIWFLSGLIISFIGIVGLYVGKTFQAARRRPVYIMSKIINAE